MKINTKNTDPKYWENVLRRHMLSEEQLELSPKEELEDELCEYEGSLEGLEGHKMAHKTTLSVNKDFDVLRTKLDTNDPFISSGHQINKVRGRERSVPDWALSDEKVRNLIQTVFPEWRTNARQRFRASRWVRVIHLFYRLKISKSNVAKEMGVSENIVKCCLNAINRAVKGRRANNAGPRSVTPTTPLV